MANVQSQFEKFNNNIQLGRFEENQTLRDKRDIIRRKLKANLPGVFDAHGEECPKFDFYDQGSYEMDTGTKPLGGDYDIDQGMYFLVSIKDYPDPVLLKERVHEALNGHTDDVQLRRACVTAFYHCDEEPIYHVDVAIYSDASMNADGKSYHAKGKRYSAQENRYWDISNPQKLSETIFAKFANQQDRAQFRRIIRYLKRWKAVNFSKSGGGAPNGIGLTILAYDHLQTEYTDRWANKHDDLKALRRLIQAILARFAPVYDKEEQAYVERLVVNLPIEPWNDLFERMTNKQMGTLKAQFSVLRDALLYAEGVTDPVAACERLQLVFGEDFKVPEKQETASQHPKPIAASGNSA